MRKQTDQDKYCDLVIRIGVCQRISVYDEKQGVLQTFYILFSPEFLLNSMINCLAYKHFLVFHVYMYNTGTHACFSFMFDLDEGKKVQS